MKNLIDILKWIKSHCGKYLFFVFVIIIVGSISSIASVYRALVLKNLVDSALTRDISLIIKPLIVLAFLILMELILRFTSLFLSSKYSVKLSASIQKKLYTHIINSKWQQQIKYHSGHLLSRITSDVNSITEVVVTTLPSIITLSILLITSFITLYHFAAKLTLAAVVIVPFSIFVGKVYTRKLKDIYKKSQEIEANYRSFMQESIQNTMIIKTFCLENVNLTTMDELQNSKIKLTMKRSLIGIFSNMLMSIGSWCGFFLVFCWGSISLSNGTSSYGTLTALLQLISNIQTPFYGLAGSLPQITAAIGAIERLMEIENMTLEESSHDKLEDTFLTNSNTDIEFKDVTFSYNQEIPVLQSISFNIKAGETVGILGPSGEGKTTIIRVLLSLIETSQGYATITKNSEEYPISPSTRSLISYVPQGNTLFSGSIKSNLLYGNEKATEKELEAALEAAGALTFINSLNSKLDTVIGEKGVGLSEGQAQRIAIARALLRKKPILILDEATSSLDSDTELKVLNTVKGLQHNPTCIIITHRPSALSICDRLFKLEKGYLYELSSFSKAESAISLHQDII